MPVSTYDKKYLHRALGFKISDIEIARNIGSLGLAIKRESEKEFDIEFKANRPDLISTVGLARAVRYFMRRSRSFGHSLKGEKKGFGISVGSGVAGIRPVVAALVVEKMRLGEEELKDVINFTDKLSENYGRRRKKLAIGLHDLKYVMPPFTYDAYDDEEFVPLNRTRKMRFSDVLKAEEKGRKYGALLGDTKRRYVALKDASGTLALVPIINSERTRVTKDTRSMIIDVTGSSKHVIGKVADMLAANFIDMGCDVYSVRIGYGGGEGGVTPLMETHTVKMPVSQLEKEIGVKIGFGNVILLANKMGYEASLIGNIVRFEVPAYRLDFINEQDIIEDIAIAYGYDYIQPVAIPSSSVGRPDEDAAARAKAAEAMIGLGYSEMMNSYLTNPKRNFALARLREQPHVGIANPKTEVATMLRTWLVPSLLECLGKSVHDRLPQRLFELDLAFGIRAGKPEEEYRLAAVACDAKVNFNEAKADLEALGRVLGIDFGVEALRHDAFVEGRCAAITVKGRKVGFLGEVHPEVLANFGIEEPVLAIEIGLDAIVQP